MGPILNPRPPINLLIGFLNIDSWRWMNGIDLIPFLCALEPSFQTIGSPDGHRNIFLGCPRVVAMYFYKIRHKSSKERACLAISKMNFCLDLSMKNYVLATVSTRRKKFDTHPRTWDSIVWEKTARHGTFVNVAKHAPKRMKGHLSHFVTLKVISCNLNIRAIW